MSKKLDNIFNKIKNTSIPIDYDHQYDLIMAKINGEQKTPVTKSIFNFKYASIAAMAAIICVITLSNINIIYGNRDDSINEFLTSTFYLEETNEIDETNELDALFGNGTFI